MISNVNIGNLNTSNLSNNIQNTNNSNIKSNKQAVQNDGAKGSNQVLNDPLKLNKNQLAKPENIKDVNTKPNIDNVSINSNVVEEVEAEVIEKPKFEWKYNTTKDGNLPDFKLGEWEKTSETLFGNNTMVVGDKTFAVFLPQGLQDKMAKDPNFAKEINSKLEEFFEKSTKNGGVLEDGTSYSVVSQHMAVAMDENGNISHTYVRTESFSLNKLNPDENAQNKDVATLDLNPTENNKNNNGTSISVSYGFSVYQQNSINNNSDGENKNNVNSSISLNIGMKVEITFETEQVGQNEPTTKVRRVNGDIVELETGKIIQKNSDSNHGDIKKYNATA